MSDDIEIINDDFYKWCMGNIEPNSVDVIITDPPYPKEFLHLWDQLGEVATRVLKPSSLLIAYSGQYHLPNVMDKLAKHLNYYWMGCLKHTGSTGVVFPRKFIAGWKPILFFQKPPHKVLNNAKTDFYESVKRDKSRHKWGQSESGVDRLVLYFTEPGDLILEPFAGGGTTLSSASKLGRRCIGIEIDKKYAEITDRRLDKTYLQF